MKSADKLVALLGVGRFSCVKCFQTSTSDISTGDRLVAIKQYDRQKCAGAQDRINQIFSEKQCLNRLTDNPYIVKLIDTTKDEKSLYFIMEPVLGGAMHKHIYQSQLGRFNDVVTRCYLLELISALLFMSSKGVIHRDIKVNNLLLDQLGHIKIVDFGCSRILYEPAEYDAIISNGYASSPKANTLIGTRHMIAPEMRKHQQQQNSIHAYNDGYSVLVDWWALGIVAYEMVCGILTEEQMQLIEDQVDDNILDELMKLRGNDSNHLNDADDIQDFIRKCLILQPIDRIGPFNMLQLQHHQLLVESLQSLHMDWKDITTCSLPHSPNLFFDRRLGYLDLLDDNTIDVNDQEGSLSEQQQMLFDEY